MVAGETAGLKKKSKSAEMHRVPLGAICDLSAMHDESLRFGADLNDFNSPQAALGKIGL